MAQTPTHPAPAVPSPAPQAGRLSALLIGDPAPARLFTAESATRTLPLIGRVAADAAAEWARARRLHDALARVGRAGDRAARRELTGRLLQSVRRMEGYAPRSTRSVPT